jgi:3-oxoacyl-(acyl-carrier-protein) synthase
VRTICALEFFVGHSIASEGFGTTALKGFRALQFTKDRSRPTADPALASQPFAAERDGFAAAEGADVLILESLEHAEERNAEILAEIVVYETSGDAILMQPAENGDDAYGLTMTGLKYAERTPDGTCYVNADRTSTPGLDLIETTAPESLELANQSPFSSTISLTEHLAGYAEGSNAAARPLLSYAERKHAVALWAVVASLFVLVLLATIFGRPSLFTP